MICDLVTECAPYIPTSLLGNSHDPSSQSHKTSLQIFKLKIAISFLKIPDSEGIIGKV